MMREKQLRAAVIFLIFIVAASGFAIEKRPLKFTDVMKFREIQHVRFSNDGRIIAYTAQPDRGDGEVIVHAGGKTFSIPLGSRPVISADSRWVAAAVVPSLAEKERSDRDKNAGKPENGLALLETATGRIHSFQRSEDYVFSDDSQWLAFLRSGDTPESGKKKPGTGKYVGKELTVYHLTAGQAVHTIPFVRFFAFDSTSRYLAYAVADTSARHNSLNVLRLDHPDRPETVIDFQEKGIYEKLTWNNRTGVLAYLAATLNQKGEPDSPSLWIWDPEQEQFTGVVGIEGIPQGWEVPMNTRLSWSEDGERLFFGLKPAGKKDDGESPDGQEGSGLSDETEEKEPPFDPYDTEAILKGRGVDVWHWNDPLINSQQKVMWPREKNRTFLAVYHVSDACLVQLADEHMPDIRPGRHPRWALGMSDLPYRRLMTWLGRFADIYLVDMRTGEREKILEKYDGFPRLSPGGRYVVYYDDAHWHVYNRDSGKHRNMTRDMNVPFYNEDHDYPSPVPGYGVAGWLKEDAAVLIYDKYDIWMIPLDDGEAVNVTGGYGRKTLRTFRLIDLEPDRETHEKGERLLLSSYHHMDKNDGFYETDLSGTGVKVLLEEKKKFRFITKAKDAEKILYTRESFEEFPDLWTANLDFRSRKKISEANPQMDEFAWGKAELVEWNSLDGIPLQGVLIKPADYKKGERYPVLVYYYRFFSQRLYEFNQMVVNHRPNFPFYSSNGYCVFLPDVRFEVGRPGFSATKCVVPGVQKLIDMGVADPRGVALHGHSWSGYQTAFVVTQTHLFACAIAGAPVSNMTSAYSGIRWGSGMARQFQYEQSQSRIGPSLFDAPHKYIENSPVFFAKEIQTPMLIMSGDEDEAVPWYQSIELYLAMRRLEKDCIFLQYRKEPHHPQKYANKLDYSIRMKEYLDHYCKGAPAPDWIRDGIPYQGK
ncbi:MAG TPA: S9 family peptidase [bacterium]|nr:S9 family peptidase [bacterium]